MANFWIELPVLNSASAVLSLNGLTGALTLAAGSGISITPSGGNTLTIATSGMGSVTSVGLSDGSSTPIYTISGSPVTSSGTLTFSLSNQSANTIFAGATSGGAAQPTFRSLVAADLPTGNLTDAGTDGITVTGGTGAVIGSGASLSQHVADSTHNGYLSSTDWSTFNGKQAAGNYITALTGDGTAAGPGSVALTLATVNSNVGSFGSSTAIPAFTVNAKGLVTAASSSAVIAPAGTLTGTTLASNVVTSSLTSVGTQAAALNMGSHLINGVTDPVSAQDAATKNYVDAIAQGLSVKNSALVGTTANITLSGEQTIDGVLTSASRILVKNQSTATQNGIYTTAAGAWTRTSDYANGSNATGTFIFIESGTINSDTGWVQTANPGVVGTNNLAFTQFSGAGSYTADGQGVKLSGTQFSFSIDGSTLSQSSSGAKVATGGITNTEVNASAAIAYSKLNLTGSIVNADINASAAIVDTKLATISTASKVSNSATTATSANTASAIVARDGSGNFTAGTVTAALTGTASGNTTYSANNHGVVISSATNAMIVIAPDASATKVLKSGGSSADPSWLAYDNANTVSTLVFRDSSGNFSAGTVSAALTGTASGNTTYSANNHGMVVSSATNAMTVVAPDSSTTKYWKSGGSSADPSWSAIDISTASVTGTLPIANGGTGQTAKAGAFDALSPMTTGGDIIYGGASGTGTRLANGSSGQVLTSSGGTAAPTWAASSGVGGLVRLSQTVLGSAAASVTFSSISGAYTNLKLIVMGRSANNSGGNDEVRMQFNGDTGTNYGYASLASSSTGVFNNETLGATSLDPGGIVNANGTANYADCLVIDIPGYAQTTFYKSFVCLSGIRNSVPHEYNESSAGHWANTAAITSIVVFLNSGGNFVTGSTFTLYGLT